MEETGKNHFHTLLHICDDWFKLLDLKTEIFEVQGLLLLILGWFPYGCGRVRAFGFVQSQNKLVWTNVWRCDIQSDCCWMIKKVIVTSGLINREMTKTGQATGLSGSHPLGYIITDLENQLSLRFVPFACFGISTVADHNRRWWYIRYTQAEVSGWSCVGRVARCSCWTPVYLSLEVHWSEVVPYLVIVWNPFSTTCFTVLIVPNYAGTWDASIPAIFSIYFKILDTTVLSVDFL